jgi:hypothetical protein
MDWNAVAARLGVSDEQGTRKHKKAPTVCKNPLLWSPVKSQKCTQKNACYWLAVALDRDIAHPDRWQNHHTT